MCYTCGCKLPYEDHGDPRNLTEKDLIAATRTKAASGASVEQVKKYVEELIQLEADANELAEPKQKY